MGLKPQPKNHPLVIYADGLDAAVDGRGFGAEHFKAQCLLEVAPEMLNELKYWIQLDSMDELPSKQDIKRIKALIKKAKGK